MSSYPLPETGFREGLGRVNKNNSGIGNVKDKNPATKDTICRIYYFLCNEIK
jgi:hypothetical protein